MDFTDLQAFFSAIETKANEILGILHFRDSTEDGADRTSQFLKDWISTSSREMLVKFLLAISGQPSITPDMDLTVCNAIFGFLKYKTDYSLDFI